MQGLLLRTREPKRRAELEAELVCPPAPDELVYVWNIFLRLNARRPAGFSIEPVSFGEIEAFTRLSGLTLSPFEVRLIEDLDNLFRTVHLSEKS